MQRKRDHQKKRAKKDVMAALAALAEKGKAAQGADGARRPEATARRAYSCGTLRGRTAGGARQGAHAAHPAEADWRLEAKVPCCDYWSISLADCPKWVIYNLSGGLKPQFLRHMTLNMQ